MTFSGTPIEPHASRAVGGVEQHARDRAGALRLVEDADLEVDELDVAQVRVDLADRVAQRAVERVDRAVALGGAHVALAVDPDLDRRLGLDLAVGALLDDHAPGLEPEQRLVRRRSRGASAARTSRRRPRTGSRACSSSLTRSTTRAAAASSSSSPAAAAFSITVPSPGELGDQQLARVADERRVDVLERRASALTPATCIPPLCAKALLADVGLVGVGREVEQLVDEVRGLGQARELLVGQARRGPS